MDDESATVFSGAQVDDAELNALLMAKTKNQLIAQGLREVADFIENTPEMPALSFAWAGDYAFGDAGRAAVIQAHRVMQPCVATANDHHVTIKREFTGGVHIAIAVNREAMCEKIVTWKCADAELMASLGLKKE